MKIILLIVLKHLKVSRYAIKKLTDKKLVNKEYYKRIDRIIKDIQDDFDMK